ncbi:hypothetical protein GCM10011581_21780 [Saccharopolyspora subtropica]|uniref:Uncharacterized protein n=1 Tax=Saccharopolyspora thermophila TaxID=89367 RepID=A0A917JS21_9PSEU|nr:hypothetical protein [Saccharopolyspora subtropica]GGI84273.1 hypothetical protein GCM10011581_21780 [Saccharopolyspora subtropica]
MGTDVRRELLDAAQAVERLAAVSTAGDWRLSGLLATRPEVVAHRGDGSTEHVAEARADSARWIVAFSPAVAHPLADWLRAAAEAECVDTAAVAFARALRARLP